MVFLENCNSCALKKQFCHVGQERQLNPTRKAVCSTHLFYSVYRPLLYTINLNNPRDPNAKYSPAAPERGEPQRITER